MTHDELVVEIRDDGGSPVREPRPDMPPPGGLFADELEVPEAVVASTTET